MAGPGALDQDRHHPVGPLHTAVVVVTTFTRYSPAGAPFSGHTMFSLFLLSMLHAAFESRSSRPPLVALGLPKYTSSRRRVEDVQVHVRRTGPGHAHLDVTVAHPDDHAPSARRSARGPRPLEDVAHPQLLALMAGRQLDHHVLQRCRREAGHVVVAVHAQDAHHHPLEVSGAGRRPPATDRRSLPLVMPATVAVGPRVPAWRRTRVPARRAPSPPRAEMPVMRSGSMPIVGASGSGSPPQADTISAARERHEPEPPTRRPEPRCEHAPRCVDVATNWSCADRVQHSYPSRCRARGGRSGPCPQVVLLHRACTLRAASARIRAPVG